jgi:hypothetical protein
MYIDYLALFSNAQVISGTSTVDSSSYYDHGSATDVGPGTETRVEVTVTTSFTGTSQTLQVLFQTSADHVTWTTLWTSKSFSVLTAGTKLPVPPVPPGCLRYIQLSYKLGTTEAVGALHAALVIDENLNDASGIPGSP